MNIKKPFHLSKWINDNRALLKPPIGNKNIYKESGNYIVMIVGGPNARKDYHYNQTEELFFQLEGDITVELQEQKKVTKIFIKEGELFLLPAGIPHRPVRPENTVGMVIERKRGEQDKDGLRWFCEQCNRLLKAYDFHVHDIEKDFIPYFKDFYNSIEARTCPQCGTIMPSDPRFV